MRQVKDYSSKEEYLRDKPIMHNAGWRPINHLSPYNITWIKGNEPENQEQPKTRMSESEYIRRKALNDNVEIT